MIRTRCGWAMFAGLGLAAIGPAPAAAQSLAGPIPPPHGAVTPTAVGAGDLPIPPPPQPTGCPVELALPGPAPAPFMPTPPPSDTSSDQQRLGRWRWHWLESRRKHQAQYLGYPEEFNEWPLGRVLYAHGNTQVANATAARMVFYEYDFVDGTAELNLRGSDKLAVIGGQLPTNFFPVVIERTPKAPGLDQARRLTVLGRLASGPFAVPAERVVIGPPVAIGRRAIDATLVERNRLGSVASGGALGGAAGSAGGAGTGVGAGGLDGTGLSGGTVSPGIR